MPGDPGGWLEGFIHLSYNWDMAPCDYHMFMSMSNINAGEKFTWSEACQNRLSQFFANSEEGFYETGIIILPSKWQQVIEQNGA